MIVKTQYNRELHPCNYEINNEPSETIPDQTMSIRTILDRYAKGLPIGGIKNPTYQEGEDFDDLPDPRTLDLSERQELAENYKKEMQQIKIAFEERKKSGLQSSDQFTDPEVVNPTSEARQKQSTNNP